MKVMVALPTDWVHHGTEFVSGGAVRDMAQHLEAVGMDGAFVTDHPAPDDRWLAGGGHHALEPTVALSFAAAATTSLRLVTNVYVAAYRPPLLAAKSLASLDALSDGRLIVGVAAGYLRPEFRALGVDFDTRGARLDATIDVMRAAWSGESVQLDDGQFFTNGATVMPTPIAGAAMPIWAGGNSKAAMRRAVERCDGWMPFATPPGVAGAVRTAEISSLADLAARLDVLDRLCEEVGRKARPTVCYNALSTIDDPGRLVDEVGGAVALGAEWVAVNAPSASTRSAWCEAVSATADALASLR